MARGPLESAQARLEEMLEKTTDEELRFNLRTALQLVIVAREELARGNDWADLE